MFDGKAFGEEIVAAVVSYVDKKSAQLSKQLLDELIAVSGRIDALEKRLDNSPDLRPELDGIKSTIAAIEIPEIPNISKMIEDVFGSLQAEVDEIHKKISELPEPKNGEDGKSVTVEDVRPLIVEEVNKVRDTLPVKEGTPGKDGKDGEPGKDGKDGADGVNLAGAFIDKNGELVLTLSNGSVKNLGPVIGKNGEPGKDGVDGIDGIGFDDMHAETRDDGLYLVWEKEGVTKEARIPSIQDRGVWKEGNSYRLGDAVSWGGSLWIAKKDNPTGSPKSEGAHNDWRLAVKKGRDGRDGRDGIDFTKPVALEKK